MRRFRRANPMVHALYLNAALLLAILVLLAGRNDSPGMVPAAWGDGAPIMGEGGVYVMPARFSQSTWGCYLLDVERQTLAAYQYFPGDRELRLVAARNFEHDRRLGNFNTTPSPREIADLVEREAQRGRGQ